MRRSRKGYLQYDRGTEWIAKLLGKVPRIGSWLSRGYLWKPSFFNFMIVGGSGVPLNWVLYEGLFRRILESFWGGTFLALTVTVILVFLWNYTWNKIWCFSPASQILQLKRDQLLELRDKIEVILSEKHDHKGERPH